MCQNVKEIKFCTCLKNEVSIQPEPGYRWSLYRYVGHSDSTMDGMLMEPGDRLDTQVTDRDLVDELNERNCFDFEYSPGEGDNLLVWQHNGSNAPMSFIFKNDQWKIAQYDTFRDRIETIHSGKIKFDP